MRFSLIMLACMGTVALSAAEHKVSAMAKERHKALREYFAEKEREESSNSWDQPYMTGDWGGVRHTLAKAGVTFDAAYVADILGNPVGGRARGLAYAGSFGPSMNINFDKAGVKGLDFYISAVWRFGTNLSEKKIGNQFPVAQVFGSETVKLNELYLRQSFLDERIEIKAGRLNGGNDFLSSPLYWKYVSNAFDGNPIGIFFNVPFVAYPNSTWGAFLELKPFEMLSTKWAVYNANSEISANKYHGANFTFSSTNGVLWMTQWNLMVNQGKNSHGMPGNYQLGAFYLTGSTKKFSGGSQSGDPGYYAMLDQMIYRPDHNAPKRGLTAFVALLFQPKNRNLFPFFTDGGLVYEGISSSRPHDSLCFGVAHGSYSKDLASIQRKRGLPVQDAETVLELNYWASLCKWLAITPDIQYIIRPKGLKDRQNALVVGVQISLSHW